MSGFKTSAEGPIEEQIESLSDQLMATAVEAVQETGIARPVVVAINEGAREHQYIFPEWEGPEEKHEVFESVNERLRDLRPDATLAVVNAVVEDPDHPDHALLLIKRGPEGVQSTMLGFENVGGEVRWRDAVNMEDPAGDNLIRWPVVEDGEDY